MVVGLAFGVQALLALGPKVISLMPGLIRASIVSKLQFPGTTAPGWLMMLAAPFYALFAYIIVLLPYQITGSWQFVVGNVGVMAAQVFIGISGRRLTVPLTAQESHDRIHKSWLAYIGILVVSASFMVYGLYEFISQMHLGAVRVVTGVLAFISNVLLDTLVGTDAIVSAMAYFRRRGERDPVREQLLRDAETKLDVFCA
jgi:magnesium-transporting ATPase (P-type)